MQTRLKNALLLAVMFMPVVLCAQNRVVAYYPGWIKTKLSATKVMFQHITHINHAFAWPTANGAISSSGDINHPDLISETHKAGKKILISLGGWGQSAGFSPVAADTNIRRIFIQNLISFCTTRGYDGADFDWEYPTTTADRANLTALIKEVRAAFDTTSPPLLLTMVAVAGDWNGQWHDYAQLAEYVDWFNLMAYDFHGNWEPHHAGPNAPLYAPTTDHEGSAHQAVLYLIGRGIPKSKLHLGMPFYGREFNASQLYGPASGGTDLEYSVVALRTSSIAWDYFWDDISKVPYLLNTSRTKFVTFDDSLSITMKCQYAKNEGLGGVMIWALGQDLVAGEQRLMEAVGIAMGTATGVHEPEPPKTIVKTFELFQNYPNPFNPTTTISFFLQRDMNIKLSIYDITGRHVTILQEVKASKGMNAVTWDASDQASGPYFYRLEGADGLIEVRKMILLR